MKLLNMKSLILPNMKSYSGLSLFVVLVLFIVAGINFPALTSLHAINQGGSIGVDCINTGTDQVENYFNLDLIFGRFTYSQAKTIDVLWDIIFGQGGRLWHAWGLYRYVIYPLLVYVLETSAVTYEHFASISFSTVSFGMLWTLLTSMFSTKGALALSMTLLSLYMLCHALFFPVLWSTATGYISHSRWMYAMPDGNFVPLQSSDLALCWVLDSGRLGLEPGRVEIGPSFKSMGKLNKAHKYKANTPCHTFVFTAGGWMEEFQSHDTIWNDFSYNNDILKSSENFRNIRACKLGIAIINTWWMDL